MSFYSKLLVLPLLALMACDTDDDSGQQLGSIGGTLELAGAWPSEGEIQISLFAHWDESLSMSMAPGGPPEFYTETLVSSTPDSMTHAIAWRMENVNPGTYPCMVAGWRNGGQQGADEPVLGMYGANFAIGDTIPQPIVLAEGQNLEIDFLADLDRIPEVEPVAFTVQVSGSVEFPADWPTGYANGLLILLMESTDPAHPGMPQVMQTVTQSAPEFNLELETTDTVYNGSLVVYGYPFDFTDPLADFYGGHGWDWQDTGATLAPLGLNAQAAVLENLVISCRPQE